MTVIVAGFVISVTALRVQSARMRGHSRGQSYRRKEQGGPYQDTHRKTPDFLPSSQVVPYETLEWKTVSWTFLTQP